MVISLARLTNLHRITLLETFYFPQVLDIVWKNCFDLTMPRTMDDFICHHEKFVSPDYVLAEHLTLFFMLEDAAVFAEYDKSVQPWKSKHGAFHLEATWNHVRKLVVMPIHFSPRRWGHRRGTCVLLQTQLGAVPHF